MDRVIFHCDLNCFYASVELLSHPELREVPVAVAGDPASRHGIILAKNEPAKQCGVKTAETIWQAKKKCPNLVLLPAHHKLYREYSNKVNAIYDEYTDLAESFGIDESWLDVTNTLHLFGGDAKALANAIRQRVKRELGLTLSVGVSFNKVFAKLGSDYKKPDATTVISRENWRSIVWPLPVGDLLYVGGAAQKLLGQYGVKTIGQLAACKKETLETLMGKMGTQLYEYANGLDSAPVRARLDAEPVKSVGNGTTFPQNLTTRIQVRSGIAVLADSVSTRLRREGLYAGGIQVTVRDPAFHDRSRQKQLPAPTHLIRDLTNAAMALTEELWTPPAPIRALTVTAIHLSPAGEAYEQANLFDPTAGQRNARQEKLESRYGRHPKKIRRRRHRLRSRPPRERGGPPAMTRQEEKQQLRAIVRRLEAALAPEYKAKSARSIAHRLLAMPEYQEAQTVFCFVGTDREIDTRPILEDALAAGKTLCVPLCTEPGRMESRQITDLHQLVPGRYGLLEPTADTPVIPVDAIDFAVLPCVTCNYLGQRLGHGGGYYDRFLSQYRGGTVLLCRELLIRQEIPVEPHDYPVPWVLTERGLYEDGIPAPLG